MFDFIVFSNSTSLSSNVWYVKLGKPANWLQKQLKTIIYCLTSSLPSEHQNYLTKLISGDETVSGRFYYRDRYRYLFDYRDTDIFLWSDVI